MCSFKNSCIIFSICMLYIKKISSLLLNIFPCDSVVKILPTTARDTGDPGSIPGLGRPPWRRTWQPTPVFLPGESHGQWSLAGYSPWGHKESDTTNTHTWILLDI